MVLPPTASASASQPHPPVVPVKWLLHWQPNPGTTLSSQILTEICQCVEEGSLGEVSKEGRWKTSLTFYRSIPRAAAASGAVPAELSRDFLGVALHDHPGLYLFIIPSQRLVLQAEASIQTLMERLQSYKARFVLNFEGFQYRLGDFRVRVGKCVPAISETLRGIMMEVEYLPLSSLEVSRMVMEDLFDIWEEALSKKSLPGHFINVESNFAEYGLHDIFTPRHTAIQYANCIAQLMADVRSQ